MDAELARKSALVTGSAGFIGYHVSKRLLDEGWHVIGVDSMTDYYDVALKHSRESILLESQKYKSIHEPIQKANLLSNLFDTERPEIVIHLAAQAGVRFSINDPRTYIESNVNGTFELLEAARQFPPKHLLMASSSSVYGGNDRLPYKENDRCDLPMSFYAATKKSNENFAHSYSHLYGLPITMFRFFTVYGPWGRPDMALFKFTKAMLDGDSIDLFNYGSMKRDFTYVDDLIEAIFRLKDLVPKIEQTSSRCSEGILSPIAPYRILNIGNSKSENLMDYVSALEKALGIKAIKKLIPIQAGDVPNTWADTTALRDLISYQPNTSIEDGVQRFVDWYRMYYKK